MKEIEIMEGYVEIGKILELAEINVRNDGMLVPVAFGFSAEQTYIYQVQFRNDDEKKMQYFSLGVCLKKCSCFRFVLLNDVAIRNVSLEQFNDVVKNYETERPTTYPESMRDDAIFLQDYDLNTKKCVSYCKKFKKVGDDLVFEEAQKIEENVHSMMVRMVLAGVESDE